MNFSFDILIVLIPFLLGTLTYTMYFYEKENYQEDSKHRPIDNLIVSIFCFAVSIVLFIYFGIIR